MMIEVRERYRQEANGIEYRGAVLAIGTKKVSVMARESQRTGLLVTVIVHNAAHSVWKGMGREFHGWAAALANYKDRAIRAILEAAPAILEEE